MGLQRKIQAEIYTQAQQPWGPNYMVLGLRLPCGLGSRRNNARLGMGTMQDLARKERGENSLTGGPWEGTMWFWIKNWRFST